MSGAVALAADERLAAYDFGPGQGHPFRTGRLAAGLSLLRAAGVLDNGDLLGFGPAADADLELVHDPAYLGALARFSTDAAPADPACGSRARPARRSSASTCRASASPRRRLAPGRSGWRTGCP